MYKCFVKPFMDFVLAFFAIILLSPLFLVIAIMIRLDSKGPIFFRQERLGKNGRVFRIFKFRSMVVDAEKQGMGLKTCASDPRITKSGAFLRKTSLDEIPQLLNVLFGDMSFIGPRPPVTYFPKKYEEYNDFEKRRFSVRPGISGLAAIRCREIHDWNINIPIDVEYVEHLSFSLDMKLFSSSLMAFFNTTNIYSKEEKKV